MQKTTIHTILFALIAAIAACNSKVSFSPDEEELLRQASDPEEFYREDILPRKLALYEDYLNNQTFWGDILIIMRTIKSVVFK